MTDPIGALLESGNYPGSALIGTHLGFDTYEVLGLHIHKLCSMIAVSNNISSIDVIFVGEIELDIIIESILCNPNIYEIKLSFLGYDTLSERKWKTIMKILDSPHITRFIIGGPKIDDIVCKLIAQKIATSTIEDFVIVDGSIMSSITVDDEVIIAEAIMQNVSLLYFRCSDQIGDMFRKMSMTKISMVTNRNRHNKKMQEQTLYGLMGKVNL